MKNTLQEPLEHTRMGVSSCYTHRKIYMGFNDLTKIVSPKKPNNNSQEIKRDSG